MVKANSRWPPKKGLGPVRVRGLDLGQVGEPAGQLPLAATKAWGLLSPVRYHSEPAEFGDGFAWDFGADVLRPARRLGRRAVRATRVDTSLTTTFVPPSVAWS